MSELFMTLNVRREHKPGEKKILLDISSQNRTQMEIVLKSELFRNVSSSSGFLHVKP